MSEKVNLNNVPTMTITEIVDSLSKCYSNLVNNNIDFSKFPSVMLWGQPGVGKSQSVRQIAKEIEKLTNKKVNITDVRLLLFNPIDLRGIPTSNADKTLAIWLRPKIFNMDISSDVVNILFLDEISSCPQSVQAAAYQITLDRTIGEHKLPDNCIVIAAGNRITDKSVVNKMPKALANRLMHIDVEIDFTLWYEWALKNNVHRSVLSFLKNNRKLLNNFESETDTLTYATPRTWEMVSNVLNCIDSGVDSCGLIQGLVGKDVGLLFYNYLKTASSLPNIKDIFDGKVKYSKMSEEEIMSLRYSIINYIRSNELSDNEINNSVEYILDMPNDYSLVIMKSYMDVSAEIRNKLLRIPRFNRWLTNEGKLLYELSK